MRHVVIAFTILFLMVLLCTKANAADQHHRLKVDAWADRLGSKDVNYQAHELMQPPSFIESKPLKYPDKDWHVSIMPVHTDFGTLKDTATHSHGVSSIFDIGVEVWFRRRF